MNKPTLCRRDQNYTSLVMAISRCVNSGLCSITDLAIAYGGTETEVKAIMLSAKEERERYTDQYKQQGSANIDKK